MASSENAAFNSYINGEPIVPPPPPEQGGEYSWITPALVDGVGNYGESYRVSMPDNVGPIAGRDFGSGDILIYHGDSLIYTQANKWEVQPVSPLRSTHVRFNEIGMTQGAAVTYAEALANTVLLRKAARYSVAIHRHIALSGTGVFVFTDTIQNIIWPNEENSPTAVTNPVYNRDDGTITLAGGGWTALGLSGADRAFRIEDSVTPANCGTYFSARDHSATVGYYQGDSVYQAGRVYTATGNIAAGPFIAGQWTDKGPVDNVLAVRNDVFSYDQFLDGLRVFPNAKFATSTTSASANIVVLHTGGVTASRGKRYGLSIESGHRGALVIKRFLGGTAITHTTDENQNLYYQGQPVGPGGVTPYELWWTNALSLKNVSVYTPKGYAITLSGGGYSGSYDISEVDAAQGGHEYAALAMTNCFSGNVANFQSLHTAGFGIRMSGCNAITMRARVESAGYGSVNSKLQGVRGMSCYGNSFFINSEGAAGLGVEINGGANTLSGYVEANNNRVGEYSQGTDWISQYRLSGPYSRITALRSLNTYDDGAHFGGEWDDYQTTLLSQVASQNPGVVVDPSRHCKIMHEGALSPTRTMILDMDEFCKWQNSHYNNFGTYFNCNQTFFDGGFSGGYNSLNGANAASWAGPVNGRMRFSVGVNGHAIGYDSGGADRSVRLFESSIPTPPSYTAFAFNNAGATAGITFEIDNFALRRPTKITHPTLNWESLGVKPGMDCDITGMPAAGNVGRWNKRFTVVSTRGTSLYLHLRSADSAAWDPGQGSGDAPAYTSLVTDTGITLTFDDPARKFTAANIVVSPGDLVVLDVEYDPGIAWSWFRQFSGGKNNTDGTANDWVMPLFLFGIGALGIGWRCYCRGPGLHRARFIKQSTLGVNWSPGIGASDRLVFSFGRKVNATQWPAATASPGYTCEVSQFRLMVLDKSVIGQ